MKKGLSVRICLKEMRIKSWLKNVFVLLPLVFSLELFQPDKLLRALLLTLSFCLISSAVYVLNDINDVENDRRHAVKKLRPIASGALAISSAWVLHICLLATGLALALVVNVYALTFALAYVVNNILYSKWLKTKAVIDCFCIAAGFVLRVLVGGTIVEDGVSNWMFLTVVSLSLFMAFGKRRGELHSHGAGATRDVLEVYEINFLNGMVFTCAGLTMVFYSLWAISQKTNLVYTVPIVLFIVVRYLLLVFLGRAEADPTNLILSDKTLLISCGICGIIMVVLLYGPQFVLGYLFL
ncbi:MAG: UbiA prenyltransferase family protein [Acetatifactor sp.]|nr:UbiA prenyltransferase family protein [Acetatifactor sp.]